MGWIAALLGLVTLMSRLAHTGYAFLTTSPLVSVLLRPNALGQCSGVNARPDISRFSPTFLVSGGKTSRTGCCFSCVNERSPGTASTAGVLLSDTRISAGVDDGYGGGGIGG
ncbi:unnamed protein product, partial [Discosporangium mesarthrocarpum]